MKHPNNKNIFSGLYIVVGTLTIIASIFFAETGLNLFTKKMQLYTELTQAQGIAAGSLVSLNGVTIGNVQQVVIATNDIRKIRILMEIDPQYNQRIPQDSFLELRTQGALGDRYLLITTGASSATLNSGDLILARESKDILDLLSEKGQEATKVFTILDETLNLLKALNQDQKIVKILSNSQDATSEVRSLIDNINKKERVKINETLDKLNHILTKIDEGQGTLGALINDPSLHRQIKQILSPQDKSKKIDSLYQKTIQHKRESSN